MAPGSVAWPQLYANGGPERIGEFAAAMAEEGVAEPGGGSRGRGGSPCGPWHGLAEDGGEDVLLGYLCLRNSSSARPISLEI